MANSQFSSWGDFKEANRVLISCCLSRKDGSEEYTIHSEKNRVRGRNR